MSNQPDFTTLARQYLDLWEDQLTAMAANPDLAEQTARFFDTMQQLGAIANPMAVPGLAAMMAQMTGPFGSPASSTTDQSDGPSDQPAAAAGTAAATATHTDRDQQLVELTRRLADVEERLRLLESGHRAARGKATKKPAATKRKRT
tara:strand:- start:447 stop:887 length:441 start_codon:yes stop_codon:yes gene_type:complete